VRHTIHWTAAVTAMLVATPAALTAQHTSPVEDMQRARLILVELVEINTTNSERGVTTLAAQDYDFPVMLNEVTEAFIAGLADLVGCELGDAMRRIVTDPDDAAIEHFYEGQEFLYRLVKALAGGS